MYLRYQTVPVKGKYLYKLLEMAKQGRQLLTHLLDY